MESMWEKKMRISLSWNAKIDDTMIIDSIIMRTCMSPFSKPLLDLTQYKKISSSQTCLSTNVAHAFLYDVISSQSDFGHNCPTNHNANMHSLDLPCFYLQLATTNLLSFTKIITIV